MKTLLYLLRGLINPRRLIPGLLILAAGFYVSGVLAELFAIIYYGGVFHIGDYFTTDIFKPGMAYAAAFTRLGWMMFAAIVFVISCAMLASTLKKTNKGHKGHIDERNGAKFLSEGTYDVAKFLSKEEFGGALEYTTIEGADGYPLGIDPKVRGRKKVLCVRKDTDTNRNMICFGGSGTLKSRAIARPMIYAAINRGASIVVTDPKMELYRDTAYLLNERGYDIKVLNLTHPEYSDTWDLISDVTANPFETLKLVANIINNTQAGGGGPFEYGQQNLLAALIFYVIECDTYKGDRSLPAAYRLLLEDADKLESMFADLELAKPDAQAVLAWKTYQLSLQNERLSSTFLSGLGTRLRWLQNPDVIRLLTPSSNNISITAAGKRKCAIFVFKEVDSTLLDPISALFFTTMFGRLKDLASRQPDLRLPVEVNFILDEFCNMGKLGAQEDGRDFGAFVSTCRSYAVNLMIICQSTTQLRNRYPKGVADEILTNCDVKIYTGGGQAENSTEDYFSDLCGVSTIEVVSHSEGRSTSGIGKRPLLTPTEIRLMDKKSDILILVTSRNPALIKKLDCSMHPYYAYAKEHPLNGIRHLDYEQSGVIRSVHEDEPDHNEPDHDEPRPRPAAPVIEQVTHPVDKAIDGMDSADTGIKIKKKLARVGIRTLEDITSGYSREMLRQNADLTKDELDAVEGLMSDAGLRFKR